MRFWFYFRLSCYLLIASGFLALLVTEDYGIVSAVLFTLILVIGWKVDAGTLQLRMTPLWWNLAVIAFLMVCIADAVFLRRMKSLALVNFLIFLQTTKIFTPKQQRDYVIIYIISFFELLMSSIMTMSALFAVACLIFTIAATWALMTLHFRQELEARQVSFETPALDTLLNIRFFGGTLGMSLGSVVLALGIFIILPRVREGFFLQYGLEMNPRVSGFSDEVALGSFGRIRLDHRPVMRVELPDVSAQAQLPEKLYWRGMSYATYDGTRWKSKVISRKRFSVRSEYQKLYWLTQLSDLQNLLAQRIEIASPGLEVVFGADKIQAVEGKFLSLRYDPVTENTSVVFDPYALQYTVYSDVSLPSADALRTDQKEYSEKVKATYLQLPELTERFQELARQIGSRYDNAYDQASAVRNFLSQNYEYSLDVQRTPGLPPLEDFLFVHQAGHCEYYATGMAILLRILGVPTRIVNGFAMGRWNEFGRFFTVRQSDAHAWVEVLFPSYGWVMFDPTPATAFGETYQQFVERYTLVARLYLYSEYLRLRWNRYVVDYNREDQAQAIFRAFMATRTARRNLRDSLAPFRKRVETALTQISWKQIGILGGILGMGGLFVRFVWRRFAGWSLRFPMVKRRKMISRKQAAQFYHAMLRVFAKKGLTRPASATPGEFARAIAQTYPQYGEDVRQITEVYYAVRYGYAEITPADLGQIEQVLKKLKK